MIDASDILAPSELENSDLLKLELVDDSEFNFDLESKSLLFTTANHHSHSHHHRPSNSSSSTTTATNYSDLDFFNPLSSTNNNSSSPYNTNNNNNNTQYNKLAPNSLLNSREGQQSNLRIINPTGNPNYISLSLSFSFT